MPTIIPMRVVAVSCKNVRHERCQHSEEWDDLWYGKRVTGKEELSTDLGSLLCRNVSCVANEGKVLSKSCSCSTSSYTCSANQEGFKAP